MSFLWFMLFIEMVSYFLMGWCFFNQELRKIFLSNLKKKNTVFYIISFFIGPVLVYILFFNEKYAPYIIGWYIFAGIRSLTNPKFYKDKPVAVMLSIVIAWGIFSVISLV